jgi:hypothetical protein
VNASDNGVTRTQTRLKVVLRLEVSLVREIISREIKVNPTPETLAHAEIKHIKPRCANAGVFTVQTIVAGVAVSERPCVTLVSAAVTLKSDL